MSGPLHKLKLVLVPLEFELGDGRKRLDYGGTNYSRNIFPGSVRLLVRENSTFDNYEYLVENVHRGTHIRW